MRGGAMSDRALTVRELVQRYGVGEHTVLGWIHCGDLRAIDVSRNRGGKPRWRITADALASFEIARTAVPPPPRTRRKKQTAGIIEFY